MMSIVEMMLPFRVKETIKQGMLLVRLHPLSFLLKNLDGAGQNEKLKGNSGTLLEYTQ